MFGGLDTFVPVVQFLRLGFEGYKKIMTNLMEVAAHLAKGILDTGTVV